MWGLHAAESAISLGTPHCQFPKIFLLDELDSPGKDFPNSYLKDRDKQSGGRGHRSWQSVWKRLFNLPPIRFSPPFIKVPLPQTVSGVTPVWRPSLLLLWRIDA